MEVSGFVIHTDLQKGTSKAGKPWQKKVFVLELVEGTYTKHLAFEIFGEERIEANPFRKGQTVTVQFDIESTEWNGRWFTTLKAWRVSKFDSSNISSSVAKTEHITAEPTMIPQSESEELPF